MQDPETQKLIDQFASNPLRLVTEGCAHQVFYAGDAQIACSCDLTGLEKIFQDVNALVQALSTPPRKLSPQEPVRPVPTPLTPPTYKPAAPMAVEDWGQLEPQFTLTARGSLAELEVSEETALDVIENPDFTTPGPETTLLYFHGQGLTILCDTKGLKVVNLYRFDPTRFHSTTARVTGQSNTNARAPKPQSVEDFTALAESKGLLVELQRSGHIKITHPTMGGVVATGSTPSDSRSMENLLSQVRATFGVDLRRA